MGASAGSYFEALFDCPNWGTGNKNEILSHPTSTLGVLNQLQRQQHKRNTARPKKKKKKKIRGIKENN